MWKTSKKFWIFALILALTTPCFTACSSDDDPFVNPLDTPQYEELSARYDLTNSSSPYATVELFASGQYLIVERGAGYRSMSPLRSTFSRRAAATRAVASNYMYYGSFSQIDGETFVLEGFGRLKLRESGQGTEITLLPDQGSSVTSPAKKASVMANDEKTNALCRTWKMVKLHEKGYDEYEGHYDDTSTSDDVEDGLIQTITFSKAGTFVNIYQGNYLDAYFWKWEDQGAGIIRSSQDNLWYNGDEEGEATVSFSDNRLTLYEYYKDSEGWWEITVELVEVTSAD